MPEIQFEVTDLNGVEEGIRKAYVEKEGKFILDPDRYHEIKAEPLLRKNAELLNEKKKLADEKKSLDEKAKSGLSDVEKQLSEKDSRIATLERENREHQIWSPVKGLAVKHGVMGDRLEAVMTLLRADNRFDLEDGKLIFKDRNGYPTTIKPERAFEVYLREEIPWAFEASKAGGGGAPNGDKSFAGRTVTRESFNAMTSAQKESLMSEVAKGSSRLID